MLRHSLGGEVIFFFAAIYCSCLRAQGTRDHNMKRKNSSPIFMFGVYSFVNPNYNFPMNNLFFLKQGSMLHWALFAVHEKLPTEGLYQEEM